MIQKTKILDAYAEPKFVVLVGDYHGVILIKYTPDKKYESYIDLTLFRDEKLSINFFAKMIFNQSYTEVESKFGYFDEATAKPKLNIRDTPLFEVCEKLESYTPIKLELFIDLIKETLAEIYKVEDEFIYYQVSDKEIEKYYAQDIDEGELISYDSINNYFYVSKSVFNCIANKSEELIIDDYNFHQFPKILLSCSWIKKLELYELLISEIPEELTNLYNMNSLSLKLKFLTKLPSSLQRLKKLEVLKIERTGIAELPDNLFELINIRELHFINNKGITYLSDRLSQLKNLEYLYAYSNEIKELPKTIFRLENLKHLHLAHNNLEELPAEITALSKLKILNLKSNRLKKIPDDLFCMESLQEVDLSKNPGIDQDKNYDLLMKSGRSDKINLIV